MSVGFIGRQDDLPTQSKLLQNALGAIKGGGRTAQSLRAGLYENAMRGGLAQNKMIQDQSQFDATQQLDRDRLSQQNTQFGQKLDSERQALGVEALSGLRTGLSTPRPVGAGGGAMPSTRILRSGNSFSDTSGVYEDEVDPLERKNGGVIGNVKKDDGSDKVPVVAREGEYYINPETVAHIGGGDYKQGLRSLNALVREATGKEPGGTPVGKSGLRGFAAGGYVDSPERLAWLKDIAARGNRDPEAQAALRTFNEAQVGPAQPEPQAPVSLRRLPDEPRPTQPTLRDRLDARAEATMRDFAQNMAEERANGSLRQRMQTQTNAVSPEQLGQPSESTPTQATGKSFTDLIPSKEAVKEYFVGLNERVTGVPRAVADGAQERTFNAPPQQNAQATTPSTVAQPDTADAFRTRNAAADVYRREWQRQSPGGLRNANPQALDTYNAEQQTRGTGISAQRQANGVMEFSGSGPAPQAQYLDAGGNPTNEWQDTSQYRDAVVRSLGSNDPATQQRGLAQAMQLQQRNQRAVGTGNPEMDQLLGQMDPREAAAVYRALNGGQGGDSKAPKATPYGEQQKRVIDALGEEGAAKALPEIQQAQMEMARQLIQSGQATPEQAEAAVSNPQFLTRLTQAYKLRDVLAQNGAAAGAIDQSGLGALGGAAAGLGTLALTKSPTLAKSVGLGAGLAGAAAGGARGYTQGVQGFDSNTPLTGLMNIVPMQNGDYQIGNAIVPKSFVQKNYQLFGLTAPPK